MLTGFPVITPYEAASSYPTDFLDSFYDICPRLDCIPLFG